MRVDLTYFSNIGVMILSSWYTTQSTEMSFIIKQVKDMRDNNDMPGLWEITREQGHLSVLINFNGCLRLIK